jgi:hypothetical protein
MHRFGLRGEGVQESVLPDKHEGECAEFHNLQIHRISRDRKVSAVLRKVDPIPTEAGQILAEKSAGNVYHGKNDPLVGETGKVGSPWTLETKHAAALCLALTILAPALPGDNQFPVTPSDQIVVGFELLQQSGLLQKRPIQPLSGFSLGRKCHGLSFAWIHIHEKEKGKILNRSGALSRTLECAVLRRGVLLWISMDTTRG